MISPQMEANYLGRPIASLQQMLRTLHFCGGDIPAIIPTGEFDQMTEQGVRCFQRQQGLPETGTADYETWARLVQAFQKADQDMTPARPLRVIFQRDTCIRPGERNVHLYPYQAALCALGTVLEMPPLQVTGVHDAACVDATRWLQRQAALPESGEVDKNTWDILSRVYPAVLGDGT